MRLRWKGQAQRKWSCGPSAFPRRTKRISRTWFPVGGGRTALTRNNSTEEMEYVGSSWTSAQPFDDQNAKSTGQPAAWNYRAIGGAVRFSPGGVGAGSHTAPFARQYRLRPTGCAMGFPGAGGVGSLEESHALRHPCGRMDGHEIGRASCRERG